MSNDLTLLQRKTFLCHGKFSNQIEINSWQAAHETVYHSIALLGMPTCYHYISDHGAANSCPWRQVAVDFEIENLQRHLLHPFVVVLAPRERNGSHYP